MSDDQVSAAPPLASPRESFLGPLAIPEFRLLWTSGLGVNLAVWMQAVGASWLMLSLAPSPIMVASIQTAQSLPILLFGLPGGVIADAVNRRVLILLSYGWFTVWAGVASLLTLTGDMTPAMLLLVTAAIGASYAVLAPAAQKSYVEAVPHHHLFAALSLAAVSFNSARAIGPALAGIIVSISGTVVLFAACALFALVAFVATLRWKHVAQPSDLPPEPMLVGVRGALQYARHSPVMRAQLLRTLIYVTAASGLWALLAIVARDRLALGAGGYGLLLGCMGAGAVIGALLALALRRRWSLNTLGSASALSYTIGVLVVARSSNLVAVCIALGFAGAGWAVVGNVNLTAIQTAIPPWVRARAMALYMLVFQGAMAIGGVLWGVAATHWSLEVALLGSVVALVASMLLMQAMPARMGDPSQSTPSQPSGLPSLQVAAGETDGPLAVQVNYLIRTQDREQFLEVMQALGRSRKRDGALFWRVYRDMSHPQRYAERFIVRSWSDYLRQRERATEADHEVELRAWGLHIGATAPEMQHMLAERMPGDSS
jgi:predicted MFS family arabinose efflux permease